MAQANPLAYLGGVPLGASSQSNPLSDLGGVPVSNSQPQLSTGQMIAHAITHRNALPVALEGALQGVSDLGQGIANVGDRAVNALLGTHLQAPQGDVFAFNPQDKNRLASKVGNIAGQTAAMIGAPEMAPEEMSAIPAAMMDAGLQGGAFNTLNAANNPNASLPKAFGVGTLVGAPFGAAGEALPSYMKALATRAGKKIDNMLTPDEMQQYSDILGDHNLDLGSLIGNESLSNFANKTLPTLGLIPFVPNFGMKNAQQEIIGNTNNYADSLINSLKGGTNSSDLNNNIIQEVKNNFKANKGVSSANYNQIAQEAQNRGATISSFPSLTKTFNELQSEGSSLPENSAVTTKVKQLMGSDDLSVPEGHSNGQQDAETYNQYQPVHNLSKKLNKLAADNSIKDPSLSREYGQLAGSIKDDLSTGLANGGHQDLYNDLQNANNYYAQNVAPYRDGSIQRLIRGDKDEKSIKNALADSSNQAVLGQLSQSSKNNIGYKLLNNAITEDPLGGVSAQPANLWNKWLKIDDGLKNRIFTPDFQQNMQGLGAQVNTQRFMRDMGNKNNVAVQLAKLVGKGVPGATYVGALGAVPHLALPAIAATNLMSRGMNKLLRSQSLRDAYVNPDTAALSQIGRRAALARYPALSTLNQINGGNS